MGISHGNDRRRCGRRGTKLRRTRGIRAARTTSGALESDRRGVKIAAIAVARQFTRRRYHILRSLDPDAVDAMPT
jgi:hypothetical protein